jgi:cytochrome oxidase Cu insertion factor (SCO1/SenC/PrrC family)
VLLFAFSSSHAQRQTQALTPITSLDLDDIAAKRIAALTGKEYAYSNIIAQKSGMSVDLLKEKVIFIHNWFAACRPCVAEFEELNNVYRKLKSNKDFLFLSFTFDDIETIKKIKKELSKKE